jgi:hypothetical protein
MGGIIDFLSGAVQTAQAFGAKISFPLDNDLNALQGRIRELTTQKYLIQEKQQMAYPRLLSYKSASVTPKADAAAVALRQASAQIDSAQVSLNNALAVGQDAQRMLKAGQITVGPQEAFQAKKNQAFDIFSLAMLRAKSAIDSMSNLESEALQIMSLKEKAAGAIAAIAKTGTEAADVAIKAAKEVGRGAESVGKGALALSPILQYWPWILGGGVALYLLGPILAPRRGK